MLRIREILKEKGLSNADLITRLQGIIQEENPSSEQKPLSKQYISNVVNGRQTVSMSRLSEIARALDVAEWQLFANPAEVCKNKPIHHDFVAMVRFRGDYYHADSICELEKLIADWKEQIAEK